MFAILLIMSLLYLYKKNLDNKFHRFVIKSNFNIIINKFMNIIDKIINYYDNFIKSKIVKLKTRINYKKKNCFLT